MNKKHLWLADTSWNAPSKRAFFTKLNRSKDLLTRFQRLRIKAYYLAETGNPDLIEAALELHQQVVTEADAVLDPKRVESCQQFAKNAIIFQARIYRKQKRYQDSIHHFRQALAREQNAPESYIVELAELIIELGEQAEYESLLKLVHSSFVAQRNALMVFRGMLFRYGYVQAVMSNALGRVTDAQAFARAALQVVSQLGHGIRPDMKVDVVNASSSQTAKLKEILGEKH